MQTSRIALPALAVLATFLATPAQAAPPADPAQESVVVTGSGSVFAEPDFLTAAFGVENTAATVDAALTGASTAAGRMRDALVRAGLVKADLQTSEAGITSRQDDKQKITGYTARLGLTAKIRDIPRAGEVMAAAVLAGGDAARLNGVSLGVEDDTALLAAARRKAFADARARAELYAREAGRPLDRVVSVSEARGATDPHRLMMADSAVPVEPGRQQVTATVTVEWAFRAAPAPTSIR